MPSYQLIWTQGAIDDWRRGKETKRLLRHRISGITDLGAVRAFEDQLRSTTPRVIRSASTGFDWAGEMSKEKERV